MQVFFYDQSFEGLLSVIFDAYTLRRFPTHLLGPGERTPLAAKSDAHRVEIRPEKTERVFGALCRKLSEAGLRELLLVWLSEETGSDILLFRYLCRVLTSTRPLEGDAGDADAVAVQRLARKVSRQAERYAGFARFQKTIQDVYIAIIEPRHNVLPLLRRHFAGRFADQNWAVYDAGRHYGILWDRKTFREITLDESLLHNGGIREDQLAEGEKPLQELWKSYFEACAVPERLSLRRQQQFMPKKYWKYLTEKIDFETPYTYTGNHGEISWTKN